jgi:DNA (cytosine-5)-methyltransferase 1
MRLLDLFCGAGGAAMGYHRAGFDEIVGVDIKPQPRYPFEFIQADAMTFPLDGFDLIHASPPCQDYSEARFINGRGGKTDFPRLITDIRQRLMASGTPWIIENVSGAIADMPAAIILCGTSFGLTTRRHRLFESSEMLFSSGPCHHAIGDVIAKRWGSEFSGIYSGVEYQSKGATRKRRKKARKVHVAEAMGIDWMTMYEMGEAIPPAYTEWLGRQLLDAIMSAAA